MKKITLTSIIVFMLVIMTAFIGSYFSNAKQQKPLLDANSVGTLNNIQIENSKLSTNITEDNSNNINNPSPTNSSDNYINPPNIDINNLVFDPVQTSKDSFILDEVSKHNTKNDCYLIINNKVYDVSSYISYHPGGSRIIISRCGKEVTGIFAKIHSNRAWDLLKKYKIGDIITNIPDTTFQILTAISNALKEANPNAEIVKVSPKKSFYVAKIILYGKLYEVHINKKGQIIKQEIEDDEANWSLWENDIDDR